MVPFNIFKPSSELFSDGTSFVFMFHVCLCYAGLSVPYSLVITWGHFPINVLLRVRLVPLNICKPSSVVVFTDGTSVVDPFCYLCFR